VKLAQIYRTAQRSRRLPSDAFLTAHHRARAAADAGSNPHALAAALAAALTFAAAACTLGTGTTTPWYDDDTGQNQDADTNDDGTGGDEDGTGGDDDGTGGDDDATPNDASTDPTDTDNIPIGDGGHVGDSDGGALPDDASDSDAHDASDAHSDSDAVVRCDVDACEAQGRGCDPANDTDCTGCLRGFESSDGTCRPTPVGLGEPCSANAVCPVDAWCPGDTSVRRCAPNPVHDDISFPMQFVPSGTFAMGSPSTERGHSPDEAQVEVTLTHDFAIGRTEITQAQWRAITGANPSVATSCGNACPVENITWWSAIAFANAMSEREGLVPCYNLPADQCTGTLGNGTLSCELLAWTLIHLTDIGACDGYRLPTEAEWEYAARGGTASATPLGEIAETADGPDCTDAQPALDPLGWWCGNAFNRTHPTGGLAPNAWGLFDMHGNVWEWVWDPYEETLPGGTNPNAAASWNVTAPESHVRRGGSFGNFAHLQRSAHRGMFAPSSRSQHVGLRIARTL